MGRLEKEKKAGNRPAGGRALRPGRRQANCGRKPEMRLGLRPKGVVSVTSFKHPALKQLTDQQVRFAPPTRRLEQLARAERLLAELDLTRQYPYQFVCFRLTGFRTNSYPDLLISGDDLRHDLRLFIDRLDRSLTPVPAPLSARTEPSPKQNWVMPVW